jgi:ribonuclease D
MPRQDRPTFPPPALITDTASLAAHCERLGHEKVVTVDTEFMRERTYWPELCVVQLGSPTDTAVVDALAPGLDLAPLGALLAKPDVTKVFHAARQDVEIFVLKFGTVPTPLVDTQIAAMVAGFGDQVGYDTLVGSLTGGQIDKSHRFSDWSVRPLSQAQITYAAADVTHLRVVYDKLTERLSREGRLDWVGEEMATLTDPATYRADPERMWERLRARTNNRRVLGMLRAIAAWREREAQRANIPRGRMLKDESLLELAAVAPTDAEGLARVRGISKGFAEGKQGASLLAAMAEARALPEDQLPIPAAERNGPRPSPALVSLLKVLLAASCEAHDVAPRLVASSDDLDRIAAGETDVPALHGWRQRIFGDQAQALRDGKLALGVAGKRIKTIPL